MEKDWKLFRKKLGSWQEAYMDKLVEEYKSILNSDALSSDKYWALGLLRDEAIAMDDLEGFSDELKEDLQQLLK